MMTGEGGNVNPVNNDSGMPNFHGFNLRDINITGYMTPMFNKTGVETEGWAKEIIDNVSVE